MERRRRLTEPSLLFLGLLLLIGGLTLGLGLTAFADIRQIYRSEDLAYNESPQIFRLWFLEAHRHGSSDDDLIRAVAQRLQTMRIDKRHALIHALMSDRYLETLWSAEKDRRSNLGSLLKGVIQAVSSSPLEGDLWLAAARLRRRLSGFDEQAERYLEASFRYTPREIYLLIDRLMFAAQITTVLSPETRELARRDQQFLKNFSDQELIRKAEEQLRGSDFSENDLPSAALQ
jgi:hypothetical protein